MVCYIMIPIYNPHMKTSKNRESEMHLWDRLLNVVVVVRISRSPQYTAPRSVPTGDAFDYIRMRACHCLRGRNSIHHISSAQGGTESKDAISLCLVRQFCQ